MSILNVIHKGPRVGTLTTSPPPDGGPSSTIAPGESPNAVSMNMDGSLVRPFSGVNGVNGWNYDDNSDYDGEDYGDKSQYLPGDDNSDPSESEDGETCPYYCLEYSSSSRPSFRIRGVPASGGFASFNWPASNNRDTPDSDDTSVSFHHNLNSHSPYTERRCPESCYPNPHTTSDPYTEAATSTGDSYPGIPYGTGNAYSPYATTVTDNTSATNSWPYMSTSTSTSDMTSEPSTLSTVTTAYGSSLSNAPYPSSNSPEYPSWTGDTLAGVCPKTCDPVHPNLNYCDITTTCTSAGGNKNYCACRGGYSAGAWNERDFSKQFRVPGYSFVGRVFVAPGVVCNKVCEDSLCSAVLERPQCV